MLQADVCVDGDTWELFVERWSRAPAFAWSLYGITNAVVLVDRPGAGAGAGAGAGTGAGAGAVDDEGLDKDGPPRTQVGCRLLPSCGGLRGC